MTGGREKKPLDYEIPGSGRVQKRAFDDTEPLIVDGRQLGATAIKAPPGDARQAEWTARGQDARPAEAAMVKGDGLGVYRYVAPAAGGLAGLVLGVLLAWAFAPAVDASGMLQIKPLTSIERGIVKSAEPSRSAGRIIVTVDFGPLGIRKADLQGGGRNAGALRGCAVAGLVGAPIAGEDAYAATVVLGLLDGDGNCGYDPGTRP